MCPTWAAFTPKKAVLSQNNLQTSEDWDNGDGMLDVGLHDNG